LKKSADNKSLTTLFLRIWHYVDSHRRIQLGVLLLLMIMTSLAEVFSIGAAMPFLGVLTAPERIYEYAPLRPVFTIAGITSPFQLLLPVTIIFVIAALLAGAMRLLFLWVSIRFSFTMGADLKVLAYKRMLYQPYAVHASRNSSEIITSVGKVGNIIYLFNNILSAVSSGFFLLTILSTLLFINAKITLALFGGFGAIYAIITFYTKERLLQNSQRVALESSMVLKAMQEGLGGIRDVLIDGTQGVYSKIFRHADIALNRAQGNNLFISSSPSLGVQSLGIALIALLSLTLAHNEKGLTAYLPLLGALVYGAQRLLPSLQQLYSSWSTIQGMRGSLDDALDLLDQPLPEYVEHPSQEPLPFNRTIELNNISFRYTPEAPWVLENLDLSIEKGSRVGFIGKTGSGKSTLLDLIMGLLQPTKGSIAIDGKLIDVINTRSWQSHIAHVPQAIYLSDSTIAENIAFGIPVEEIDFKRVLLAAQNAQIAELIEGWPKKYQTFVGERGIRLSGGQRQRIGIARALYKKADVIIFDEATSALDNNTENAVMQAIERLHPDITILIIAHRLTTLKNCDKIVEVGGRGIMRIGSYDDIMNLPQKKSPVL